MTLHGIAALSVMVALGVGTISEAAGFSQSATEKVSIVAVAGCVTEQGKGDWMLSHATDPAPSIANAPSANQPYTGPKSGKHTYRLIGISEFDLPSRKGQIVLVKGLYIKAQPVSRLNVTSVTTIADACTAQPRMR